MPRRGQKSTLPQGLRKVLAAKLEAIKVVHGIDTDQELGDRIGVSRQTAGRLLDCEHAADLDVLLSISRAFKIPVAKLVDGEIPDGEIDRGEVTKAPAGVKSQSTQGNIPSFTKGSAKRNVHRKS